MDCLLLIFALGCISYLTEALQQAGPASRPLMLQIWQDVRFMSSTCSEARAAISACSLAGIAAAVCMRQAERTETAMENFILNVLRLVDWGLLVLLVVMLYRNLELVD